MSTVTGNLASPIGHTRGLPVPTEPRPLTTRRHHGTSPFGDPNVPTPPDPDAIARLVRQGRLVVVEEVREDKPVQVVRKVRAKSAPTSNGMKAGRRRGPAYDLQAAIRDYQSGQALRAVATAHRIGHERLAADLRAAGVTIRPHGWHPSTVTTERLIELHDQGLTNVAIGKLVGLSSNTIGNRLAEAGVRAQGISGGAVIRNMLLDLGVTTGQVREWCAATGRPMARGLPSAATIAAYIEAHPDMEAK